MSSSATAYFTDLNRSSQDEFEKSVRDIITAVRNYQITPKQFEIALRAFLESLIDFPKEAKQSSVLLMKARNFVMAACLQVKTQDMRTSTRLSIEELEGKLRKMEQKTFPQVPKEEQTTQEAEDDNNTPVIVRSATSTPSALVLSDAALARKLQEEHAVNLRRMQNRAIQEKKQEQQEQQERETQQMQLQVCAKTAVPQSMEAFGPNWLTQYRMALRQCADLDIISEGPTVTNALALGMVPLHSNTMSGQQLNGTPYTQVNYNNCTFNFSK